MSSVNKKERRVEIRESFFDWICGAAPHPDTGLWFERPPDALGAFWWRSSLSDEIVLCKQKPLSRSKKRKAYR